MDLQDEMDLEDGEVEYDLRDYERASFGRVYAKFNTLETMALAEPSAEKLRIYFSLARTMIKILKRYVPEDESLEEDPEEVEDLCNKWLDTLQEAPEFTPGYDDIDRVRSVVEDMRHKAGLNLPTNSKEDPTEAWKGGA